MTIDWERAALRRAKFLLDEAGSGEGVYDTAVKYALRVISNCATVGQDMTSRAIKFKNRNLSEAAWRAYEESASDDDWHSVTTNEHPEPIRQVWDWIVSNHASLTPQDIWARARLWPMITITRDEDAETNRRKFRHKGEPAERHAHIVRGREGPPPKRKKVRLPVNSKGGTVSANAPIDE